MATYLWRKYADYLYTKWERALLWNMVEPYRRPKSFTPLVTIYIAAFYTGVIGAAVTEQLYKKILTLGEQNSSRTSEPPEDSLLGKMKYMEKYWEDHPGEAVPLMRPTFYRGPWRVIRGEALPPEQ